MADAGVPAAEEGTTPVDAMEEDVRQGSDAGAEASTSAEAIGQHAGTTAFFVFSAAKRAKVREELQEQLEEGAKVKIGDIAKRIGELWRALSEEERAAYVKQAAENKARKKAAPAEAADAGDAAGDAAPATLPISVVKKVMMIGEEGGRCAGDAVKPVLHLTAFSDMAAEAVLSTWKPTAWPESPFLEIENEAQQQPVAQQSKAHKEAAEKTHKINSFFKAKPAVVDTPADDSMEDVE